MAYSSLTDILNQIDEARLVQLTDDNGVGVVDQERVTRAIADSDEEINGYVGSRHPVPLNPIPGIVRKISVDIALYNLYRRRDKMTDQRSEAYKTAIRILEQVASGKISLGASDPGGNPPESSAPNFSGNNPERVFTRSKMSGF